MNKSDFFTLDGKRYINKNSVRSLDPSYEHITKAMIRTFFTFRPQIIITYNDGSKESILCGNEFTCNASDIHRMAKSPYTVVKEDALAIIKSIVE